MTISSCVLVNEGSYRWSLLVSNDFGSWLRWWSNSFDLVDSGVVFSYSLIGLMVSSQSLGHSVAIGFINDLSGDFLNVVSMFSRSFLYYYYSRVFILLSGDFRIDFSGEVGEVLHSSYIFSSSK